MLQKYCIAMEDIVYWAQCGTPLLCCMERSHGHPPRATRPPDGAYPAAAPQCRRQAGTLCIKQVK